jgi:hypothetical protein
MGENTLAALMKKLKIVFHSFQAWFQRVTDEKRHVKHA